MSGPGSLVQRITARLAEGPVHTLDLARDVLRLEGHPGAAASAVYVLLGNDDRFEVDAGGCWSLRGPRPGASLSQTRFAVVDVETTGGRARGEDRITEIAIVEVCGGRVTDEYASLVNPGRSIPPMITRITGITGPMVIDAPYFEHIADEVQRRLRGKVFVAHNAGFDHAFVRSELQAARGEAHLGSPLCTVRMARGLIPRLRRRNLDELTRYYGIRIHDRHRAYGDALATARVLIRMLDEAEREGLNDLVALRKAIRRRNRRRSRSRKSPQKDLFEDET